MKSSPIILSSVSDLGQHLERIESQPRDEKNEKWIQRLIFEHSNLLPVTEFDESFAPLIPIGREVETASGKIDNFYISPMGRLTIVETKLWKNPEKHRTVVAQIIDYAKEVSEWSYDELNNAILKSSRKSKSNANVSLDQIVQPFLYESGLALTDFQERVMANLLNGEFLLLIVGDKISANVALLTEAIHGAPGLDFRLGLIELHLYPLKEGVDWPLLVVPDIVGRTVEETRGVIKIQFEKEKPKIAVEISKEEITAETKGRITPEVFLQKTPNDLRPVYEQWFKTWVTKKFHIYWGTVGFSLRVNVGGKLQTIIDAYPEWALSLIRESDAEKCGASVQQYQKYVEDISNVSRAVNLLRTGKKYILNDSITAEDLMTILNATTKFAEGVQD
jgi:hypothetical protein